MTKCLAEMEIGKTNCWVPTGLGYRRTPGGGRELVGEIEMKPLIYTQDFVIYINVKIPAPSMSTGTEACYMFSC